ncbi:hypothetical protein ACIP4Y_12375 [Streptomyces sp. NPDC088810]|uniref:hypothetical protein n=1 Tax=Streptomyces sp. NPDC088810 TaxID=3365904 RepID=UPI0037F48F8D
MGRRIGSGQPGATGTVRPDRPPGRRQPCRAWPPRLPEQPTFYPVLNENYAIRIARDWNVKHDGAGYVTRFEVDTAFLARYPARQAGGETILELWVPAEELSPGSGALAREYVEDVVRSGERFVRSAAGLS